MGQSHTLLHVPNRLEALSPGQAGAGALPASLGTGFGPVDACASAVGCGLAEAGAKLPVRLYLLFCKRI